MHIQFPIQWHQYRDATLKELKNKTTSKQYYHTIEITNKNRIHTSNVCVYKQKKNTEICPRRFSLFTYKCNGFLKSIEIYVIFDLSFAILSQLYCRVVRRLCIFAWNNATLKEIYYVLTVRRVGRNKKLTRNEWAIIKLIYVWKEG